MTTNTHQNNKVNSVQNFTFNTTKSVINQTGALKEIGRLCESLHIKKLMVVTDPGIIACGLYAKLTSCLEEQGVNFCAYTEIVPDPSEAVVEAALAVGRENNVDGVLGFGGGSSLDTAKLVALLLKSNESLSEVYGVDAARGPRHPLILVPTTAGTGSEATAVAIVTTGETTKMGVVSPILLPDIAILDAELTLGLPPHITAATGIDAMVHAIEAYTSKHKKNIYSDLLAKQALELLSNNIIDATLNGSNVESRQGMLLGAFLAGQAFANAPVAAVHALAYPLGGHFHIPHGLSNSLVLPHVMRFNHSHCQQQYAELAPIIMGNEHIAHSSDADASLELIKFMERMIGKLKLTSHLRDLDIKETHLPTLARDAMLQQRLLINNPREVSESDALGIYQAAF